MTVPHPSCGWPLQPLFLWGLPVVQGTTGLTREGPRVSGRWRPAPSTFSVPVLELDLVPGPSLFMDIQAGPPWLRYASMLHVCSRGYTHSSGRMNSDPSTSHPPPPAEGERTGECHLRAILQNACSILFALSRSSEAKKLLRNRPSLRASEQTESNATSLDGILGQRREIRKRNRRRSSKDGLQLVTSDRESARWPRPTSPSRKMLTAGELTVEVRGDSVYYFCKLSVNSKIKKPI